MGGEGNFKITRELLDDVRSSHQRYEVDRVAREATKQREIEMLRQQDEEKSIQASNDEELEELEEEIHKCKCSLSVANDLINEANVDLNHALSLKELKKDLVQQATAKLNVGTDRKRKFEADLQKLKAKKSKLVKKNKEVM